MAPGFGHLLVATSSQCHVFNTSSWNTPHIFDLKEPPLLVAQCERCFLLADASAGVQARPGFFCYTSMVYVVAIA